MIVDLYGLIYLSIGFFVICGCVINMIHLGEN